MTEISSQTLHVVAKELAATLNEARAAFETYSERPDQIDLLASAPTACTRFEACCAWWRCTAPRSSLKRWNS